MAAQDFKARMIWFPQTGQQNRADYAGPQQGIPFSLNVYLTLSIESLTFKGMNTFWKFKS